MTIGGWTEAICSITAEDGASLVGLMPKCRRRFTGDVVLNAPPPLDLCESAGVAAPPPTLGDRCIPGVATTDTGLALMGMAMAIGATPWFPVGSLGIAAVVLVRATGTGTLEVMTGKPLGDGNRKSSCLLARKQCSSCSFWAAKLEMISS